jgi:hypothetical protein
MMIRARIKVRRGGLLLAAAGLILGGCTAKNPALWGDPQTGLILAYRMPENPALHYTFSTDQTQTIEVMGQVVDTESHQIIGFSVQAKGTKDGNQQLAVTVESMKVDVKSPQGSQSPDMSTVIGKAFDLTITNLGKELELSGADSIQYDLGPAGKRNIASSFQAIFPDLPGRPVKVGDTWTSEDLITDKTDSVEIRIRFRNEHTLDGFETVSGLECARIKTAVTGTLEGEGEQQGMELAFKGDIKGLDAWYFAYKEGLYAGMTSSASVDGTITTSGFQGLTIPLKQKIDMETRLIR